MGVYQIEVLFINCGFTFTRLVGGTTYLREVTNFSCEHTYRSR